MGGGAGEVTVGGRLCLGGGGPGGGGVTRLPFLNTEGRCPEYNHI